MPQHAHQLTIEDAILERKRQERSEKEKAKQRDRERRIKACGTPFFHPQRCACAFCTGEDDPGCTSSTVEP